MSVDITWRSSWRDVAALTITTPTEGGGEDLKSCDMTPEELIKLAGQCLDVARVMLAEGNYKFASTARSNKPRG